MLQLNLNPNIPSLPGGGANTAQQTLSDAIIAIIELILSFSAVLAVGAIIIGAIMFIISIGNDQRVATAKKIIFWAIVGLLITGLAFLIVALIGNVFGIGGGGGGSNPPPGPPAPPSP